MGGISTGNKALYQTLCHLRHRRRGPFEVLDPTQKCGAHEEGACFQRPAEPHGQRCSPPARGGAAHGGQVVHGPSQSPGGTSHRSIASAKQTMLRP